MEVTKMLVTPQQAKTWLETNHVDNRKIRPRDLIRYLQDMRAGRWKEDTGELLKFSTAGRLIDGQHRLMALVRTGKSINFHIAFNVNEDVFDVLDTGAARSAGDTFHTAGIKNQSVLSSAISFYLGLKAGYREAKSNAKMTNSGLLQEYRKREEFWQEAGRLGTKWYLAFTKILAPSHVVGYYALFYDKNRTDAEIFMQQLSCGEGITNKTIFVLRTRLTTDKLSVKRMPQALKNAMVIKTWNAFRSGKEIKTLRLDMAKDEFPKPI